MATMHFDDTNFENEVLKGDKPVLVDFFATWCGPCQMAAPVLDKLADEMGEKLKIGKVDVDQARDIATKYEVMSIPCMVVFKEGKEVDRKVGFPGEAALKAWIEEVIK